MELKGVKLRNFYQIGTFVDNEIDASTLYYPIKVPHYQRPYKWTKDLVALLITDWYKHKESIDKKKDADERSGRNTPRQKKYFAGSLVTVTNGEINDTESIPYFAHSLIDGQQRFTTLFLTNFINFLLLRNLIKISFNNKNGVANVDYLKSLQTCIDSLFINNEAAHKEHAKNIEELNTINKKISSYDNYADVIDKVHDLLYLPKYVNEESYENAYIEKMQSFFHSSKDNQSLNLIYDRSTYNQSLTVALSHYYLHFSEGSEITFKLIENKFENSNIDKNVEKYAEALDSILETFMENVTQGEMTYLEYMDNIQANINEFLKNINLCVIQTTNTNDAYTLFEVMNDRSLALDDLDLIKNLFYRNFVDSSENKGVESKKIDDKIDQLDKQWVDDIFYKSDKMPERYRTLITYFTTVYLTQDNAITDRKANYRTALESYLEDFKSDDPYLDKKISRDFNILEICSHLLTELDLPTKRRAEKSLLVESSADSTLFKKAVFFLNALEQEGVLSGLINVLLRSIQKLDSSFDISNGKFFIDLLLRYHKIDHKIVENEKRKYKIDLDTDLVVRNYELVQRCSKDIWKISMMSDGHAQPRKYSEELINHNNIKSDDIFINIEKNTEDLIDQFKRMLENWRYTQRSSNTNLKIKTLFLRLLSRDVVNDSETLDVSNEKVFSLTLTDTNEAKNLEIDHIVASSGSEYKFLQKINDFNYAEYSQHQDLDMIHSLGNMMILPKSLNIKKSNHPVKEAISYYKNLGIGTHYLFDELENYTDDIDQICSSDENEKSKFDEINNEFNIRNRNLIKLFSQLMQKV